jgi:septum formation protein
MIILATKSPYRKEMFEQLGLEFITEPSNVNEYTDERPEEPIELVKYLAKIKAKAVAKNNSKGIVIGFDSVGYFNSICRKSP